MKTEKVLKTSGIDPGLVYEMPIFKKSTLSTNLGISYGWSYKNVTEFASGWLYMISPFVDIKYSKCYNFDKRLKRESP